MTRQLCEQCEPEISYPNIKVKLTQSYLSQLSRLAGVLFRLTDHGVACMTRCLQLNDHKCS